MKRVAQQKEVSKYQKLDSSEGMGLPVPPSGSSKVSPELEKWPVSNAFSGEHAVTYNKKPFSKRSASIFGDQDPNIPSQEQADHEHQQAQELPLIGNNEEAERDALEAKQELAAQKQERRSSRRSSGVKLGEGLEVESDFFPEPPKLVSKSHGGKGGILCLRARPPKDKYKSYAETYGIGEKEKAKIQEAFKEHIVSNRPIKETGPETPEKNRPIWVRTPGGTKLYRTKDHGQLLIFSNSIPSPDERALEQSTRNKEKLETKQNTIHITEDFLKKIYKERKACNEKRPVTQNKLMNGAANKEATGFRKPKDKWEWLHLIAWCILAKQAQDADNLVGGLNHPNTDMMFIEREMGNFAEFSKQGGFDLTVTATMEPGKQIARTIFYDIKSDDINLRFEFDAQSRIQPSITNGDYFHHMVEGMLEQSKQLAQEKAKDVEAEEENRFAKLPDHQKKILEQRKGAGTVEPKTLFK